MFWWKVAFVMYLGKPRYDFFTQNSKEKIILCVSMADTYGRTKMPHKRKEGDYFWALRVYECEHGINKWTMSKNMMVLPAGNMDHVNKFC